MTAKQEIIKIITSMSGRYAPYNIFSDWIQMSALAIQNSCCMLHHKVWKDREQLYIDTARKYTEQELEQQARMLVLLADALTEEMTDVLGEIYMEMGLGSKYTGQFFTPFHLSELCARLDIDPEHLPETGKITLNEPSWPERSVSRMSGNMSTGGPGRTTTDRSRMVASSSFWTGIL